MSNVPRTPDERAPLGRSEIFLSTGSRWALTTIHFDGVPASSLTRAEATKSQPSGECHPTRDRRDWRISHTRTAMNAPIESTLMIAFTTVQVLRSRISWRRHVGCHRVHRVAHRRNRTHLSRLRDRAVSLHAQAVERGASRIAGPCPARGDERREVHYR